jgi:hypothetical protein
VLVVVVVAAVVAGWWLLRDDTADPQIRGVVVARQGIGSIAEPAAAERTVGVYAGQGAWVDAFDFSPPYTRPAPPAVTPLAVAEMVDHGVRTLYLQSSRLDVRSPDVLEDRWLLAEFLIRGHQRGLRVVGWYLPKWSEDAADLDRLLAISAFAVLGHRFDGVAVDIEYTTTPEDPAERNLRLVELSRALRERTGGDALGAIVLPPVVTEVINPRFWPGFPWREIAPYYDVWLPMSYWSNRTTRSGYKDGYRYTEENVRRLRASLGDPDAVVHAVGGIGATDGVDDPVHPEEPLASIDDLDGFVRALRDTGAIGGSIYDWRTTAPGARARFSALYAALSNP